MRLLPVVFTALTLTGCARASVDIPQASAAPTSTRFSSTVELAAPPTPLPSPPPTAPKPPPEPQVRTTTAGPPEVAKAAIKICDETEAMSRAVSLLAPWGLKPPPIWIGETAQFHTIDGTIEVDPCVPMSDLAHELGHWVMYAANGYDFAAMSVDALTSFCPGGAVDGWCAERWVKGHEVAPGLEHSAHCVGWVLSGPGPFTKCPVPAMQEEARSRLASA